MNNKTKYFKDELSSKQEDYLLEEERDSIDEDLKNEEIMQKSNEIDSGNFETWFEDNLVDIQEAFIQDHKELLKEYAKDNWREFKND